MATHRGSCHCGRVVFEVEADLADERILSCNCSICRRKGYLHLIVEPERFTLVEGAEALREYRFNTRQAVHRFCDRCGIHPFYTPRSHPDKVSVNVRCLEGVDPAEVEVEGFDGANWEENVEDIQE
jgi:hypothetical protein